MADACGASEVVFAWLMLAGHGRSELPAESLKMMGMTGFYWERTYECNQGDVQLKIEVAFSSKPAFFKI